MYNDQKISLIIPCFNEEEGIKKILPEAPDFVDEIIVVDNNSTDKTAEVAAGLGAKVVFEAKRGYGRAIWTGVLASRSDIVVMMDGDGNHSPDDTRVLIKHLINDDLGTIWGNRFVSDLKNSMPFLNWLGNRILSFCFSILVGRWIRDSQSGMMAFRRDFLKKFKPKSKGMAFCEEIKMTAVLSGLRYKEVGINYLPRIGRSKLKMWRSGFWNLFFLFYWRFHYVFSKS